ncbi:hypothetical protein Y032_0140g2188 [Ancylostoma ceylanicum]|uniref:Uncharacterized protein n=1 Tax=Ancylostoma ceylanicum TaxID=53326 RepID=A0A016T469_9BILA|nr:hypothetical protein Y032_0140g2188 [Ancylostoma ceylanicum]
MHAHLFTYRNHSLNEQQNTAQSVQATHSEIAEQTLKTTPDVNSEEQAKPHKKGVDSGHTVLKGLWLAKIWR